MTFPRASPGGTENNGAACVAFPRAWKAGHPYFNRFKKDHLIIFAFGFKKSNERAKGAHVLHTCCSPRDGGVLALRLEVTLEPGQSQPSPGWPHHCFRGARQAMGPRGGGRRGSLGCQQGSTEPWGEEACIPSRGDTGWLGHRDTAKQLRPRVQSFVLGSPTVPFVFVFCVETSPQTAAGSC